MVRGKYLHQSTALPDIGNLIKVSIQQPVFGFTCY